MKKAAKKTRVTDQVIDKSKLSDGNLEKVAGGTDFGMTLDEGIKKEETFVLKGEIDLSKKDKSGTIGLIKIGKGQRGCYFDTDFKIK
jgi:hypothetical protein